MSDIPSNISPLSAALLFLGLPDGYGVTTGLADQLSDVLRMDRESLDKLCRFTLSRPEMKDALTRAAVPSHGLAFLVAGALLTAKAQQ